MLTGVYKPTAGSIKFLGENVTGKPPHAITSRGMGRTFQNIRLFQNMTALENVLVGMHTRMHANLFNSVLRTPFVKREEAAARGRALELLQEVGLRRKAHEAAKNLPYGEQRKLEVARALATEPQLLLLDEPTAGMNPQESAEFTQFVGHHLRDERKLTVLMIEHDMRVVMGVSDRVSVLDYGEKIAEGIAARGAEERARDRGVPREGGGGGHEAAGALMSTNGSGTPILEVGDIHTYYGSIQALKGVSLR